MEFGAGRRAGKTWRVRPDAIGENGSDHVLQPMARAP